MAEPVTIDKRTFRVNLGMLATLIVWVVGAAGYFFSLSGKWDRFEARMEGITSGMSDVKLALVKLTDAVASGDRLTTVLDQRQQFITQRLSTLETKFEALEKRVADLKSH